VITGLFSINLHFELLSLEIKLTSLRAEVDMGFGVLWREMGNLLPIDHGKQKWNRATINL
jgi:hypothetical protein